MKILVLMPLILGLAMTFHSSSAATLRCPQQIKTSESLQEKITGWDEFLDDGNIVHHFNRVTFYSGHPKEHASLAPDNEGTKGNKLIWTFAKDTIWLACGYSNTNIQLTQKLLNGTKLCAVTYDSTFSQVLTINCI